MKVAYYCQHVLGIGHFHRSLEICRAVAQKFSTTLIIGGPPVEFDDTDLKVLQLPGLRMDENFGNLAPCNPGATLEHVKMVREQRLFNFFRDECPEFFITELYPFGRKAFRFELDPILKAVKDGTLSPCNIICSVRDILVEKVSGKQKFEQRVVSTVNRFFDSILVHSDPDVITLEKTFGRLGDITTPVVYTGFVGKKLDSSHSPEQIRRQLNLIDGTKLIVASIGGGSVGSELLLSTIAAFKIFESKEQRAHLQLFCGPYCPEEQFNEIKQHCCHNITVERFSNNFSAWLETADLSLSMAGYNSCMDLAKSGIPALVYPFAQNSEQRLRATRLSTHLPIAVVHDSDLEPSRLAQKMREQLLKPRTTSSININGAECTAQHVTHIAKQS